ncbi:LUD domain-containing protein [Nocardia sp. BMG111209]|uniref:LutC/YkgG family protein n=1 Tax=Nocardia sp. BMG111209 TaxID=1160137 RepID=UPI000369B002|nr:LUD domain-containing protein [Nocardia sp. BMG111209]
MTSREEILRRVRDGLKALPDDGRTIPVPRNYGRNAPELTAEDRAEIVDLFAERMKHNGAQVHRITEQGVGDSVAGALRSHNVASVLAPDGLAEEWLAEWATGAEHRVVSGPIDPDEVPDAVLTACAGAVADSGAIVLDGGPGQGTRGGLLPNCHVCVVQIGQIDPSLPDVLDKIDPRRSITWVGGPSAPVDPEKERANGRHSMRQLVVLIVE